MLISQQLDFSTNVLISVIDEESGLVVEQIRKKNLVVKAGRNLARDLINQVPDSVGITHMAIGDGTTAVTSNDTALESEQARGSITKRTNSDLLFNVAYYLSSSEANGTDVSEAGLFNASSGGTMFARVTFDAISKTSSKSILFSWTINIGAS